MRKSAWFRSLHAQVTLWVVLPLLLIIIGVISIGILAYQRSLSTLILSRHRQMANLAAVSVSQTIDGYASILSALASQAGGLLDQSPAIQKTESGGATGALEVFNAGVLLIDPQGGVSLASSDDLDFLGPNIADLDLFQSIQQRLEPSYSNVIFNEESGEAYVLIAVPILRDPTSFGGALVGGLNLQNASLSEPIRRLTIGFNGYAYLVDGKGTIISHPVPDEIGKDYSKRPFVNDVIAGRDGEAVWNSPIEGHIVGASALVSNSRWGLVVIEPWASVNAPIRFYGLTVGILGLAMLLFTLIMSWIGVQRVITPVKSLSNQTALLETGAKIEPIASSGIEEIDALEYSFLKMAEQIEIYRSGLRKYVDAITRSQEEERRRISRELHDDTVQNLLSIQRHLEYCLTISENSEMQFLLTQLQEITEVAISGVRQISKDLRPLMLEDLGLVPALQALVRFVHQGIGAIPHAKFEVIGEPYQLRSDQELALYRITQEALSNVKKHAQANGVFVKLCFSPLEVILEVKDNGIGFTAPNSLASLTQSGSFGLMGIEERVWSAGGNLFIDSTPGDGTLLRVTLPVEGGEFQPITEQPGRKT